MNILAIIPARGGSKGIPNKNIVKLNGHPLIYYTIREALKVKQFQRVLVSTDSEKIKTVSKSCGLEVPFLRPEKFATDTTRTIDAVIDLLDTLRVDYEETYDYVCLLQPTSPLRVANDIESCINIVSEYGSGSVVSLCRIDEPHPVKMKQIKGGLVSPLLEGTDSSIPRQELPEVYELNGAIYLTEVTTIYNRQSFFADNTRPFIMPADRSVNINNYHDLILASELMKTTGSR
jgi:CMP-N,N'-diacetyllegionaminic acid synthase